MYILHVWCPVSCLGLVSLDQTVNYDKLLHYCTVQYSKL